MTLKTFLNYMTAVLLCALFADLTLGFTAGKRDYYEVLAVPKNSDQETIRKAHRILVRKYHPDATRNDPASEIKFKEVQEAYDVLSDSQLKTKYDLSARLNPVDPNELILEEALKFAIRSRGEGGLGYDPDLASGFRRVVEMSKNPRSYLKIFQKAYKLGISPTSAGGFALSDQAPIAFATRVAATPGGMGYLTSLQAAFKYANSPLSEGGRGLPPEAAINYSLALAKRRESFSYLQNDQRIFQRRLHAGDSPSAARVFTDFEMAKTNSAFDPKTVAQTMPRPRCGIWSRYLKSVGLKR